MLLLPLRLLHGWCRWLLCRAFPGTRGPRAWVYKRRPKRRSLDSVEEVEEFEDGVLLRVLAVEKRECF